MITAFGLKNLRSIRDSGRIDLKPLTLLVGANDSGKSSFVRCFPLLRQSIEGKGRAPVLWNGSLIDFGDYQTVCRKTTANSPPKTIKFSFKFVLDSNSVKRLINPNLGRTFFFPERPDTRQLKDLKDIDYEIYIELGWEASTRQTYLKESEVVFLGHSVKIQFNSKGTFQSLKIDEERIPTDVEKFRINTNSLIPHLQSFINITSDGRVRRAPGLLPGMELLLETLSSVFMGKMKLSKRLSISDWLTLDAKISIGNQLRQLKDYAGVYYSKHIEDFILNEANIYQLRQGILLNYAFHLLTAAEIDLREFSLGVSYLEPVRAKAQRYYRAQELMIDEVDSQGSNIAHFLNYMSEKDKINLNDWLWKIIGIKVKSEYKEGHYNLLASDSDSFDYVNLADKGFGFSQVIPFLSLLWRKATKNTKNKPCIIAAEQPELHLHPKMQKHLGNALVEALKISKENQFNLSLFVETHSAHLVNQIGQLIEDGEIEATDVQILIFEKNGLNGSEIKIVSYNPEGVLEEWPFGFFD